MSSRALALALAAVAFAAQGCIENDASVRFYGTCYPPAPESGTCAYPAACDSLLLGRPEVYLTTSGNIFELPVQLDNQLAANGDRTGGVDTNTFWVEELDLAWSAPGVSRSSTILVSRHPVPASGSTVMIVPFIPEAVGLQLSVLLAGPVQMTIEVIARGHFADGSSYETGKFTVVALVDPGAGGPTLGAACAGGTTFVTGICPRAGQTGTVTCE